MEMIRQAEEWMRQASALMIQAERMNLQHPETLANCRQAFVLYARAVYLLLDLDFPESLFEKGLSVKAEAENELASEASRLANVSLPMLFPYSRDLPKMIVLAVFWSSFEGYAGAACKGAEIGPGSVFGKQEAVCAVAQAALCHKIVKSLIDLKK